MAFLRLCLFLCFAAQSFAAVVLQELQDKPPRGLSTIATNTPIQKSADTAIDVQKLERLALQKINVRINGAVTYISDLKKYGQDDYWEVALKEGDCEDIALRKLRECLEAGFAIERLMLAVVYTEKRGCHVVLLVDMYDKFLVLDNLASEVRFIEEFRGYYFDMRQSRGGSKIWISF